ncbi:MAG: class I SAM-dependent methyltransferase [Actinomycetota bacterium]|nr:class I SAM-dependent methyltransferase [Actinomycetota bacterium]
MQIGALRPYEQALHTTGDLGLCTDDGRLLVLDVGRWLAPADGIDAMVLDRCTGPTLDVGCGPGRFVAALSERGIASMGLDIAETAVSLTRRRGLPAVLRSVFAPVPGEGRWPTVLLMDGNIGIGGDPDRLLRRIHRLLAPRGQLLVETHPDRNADEILSVRFSEHGRATGPSFGWAHVGLDSLRRLASETGYGVRDCWSAGGRSFAALDRRPSRPVAVRSRTSLTT